MQHLDEGTIHGWLDGQLPPAEARAVESHVASCRECADAVAEARGLIAASSRILTMLDDVPGGVVPQSAAPGAQRAERAEETGGAERGSAGAAPALVVSGGASVAANDSRGGRQGRPVRRWFTTPRLAAAAVLVVAAGTFAVTRTASERAEATLDAPSMRAADTASPAETSPFAAASEAKQSARQGAGAAESKVAAPEAEGARRSVVTMPPAAPVPSPAAAGAAGRPGAAPAPTVARERDVARDASRDESRALAANEAPLRAQVARPPEARRPDSVQVQVYRGAKAEVVGFDKANRIDTMAASKTVAARDTSVRAAVGSAIARAAAHPTGVVRGRVTQATGAPLAEAQVTVERSTLGAVTDATGSFVLHDVPAGTQRLRVRRIGFTAGERTVQVPPGDTIITEVTVSASALALQNVVVTGSGVQEARDDARQRRQDAQQMAPRAASAPDPRWPFASCYDLGITASPGTQRSGFLEIPRRIALDSVPAPERTDGVWYRVRDLAPRPGVATRPGVWRPSPPDAVEIEWAAGSRTAHVRITGTADSPMLRGSLQDIDRAAGIGLAATVVAAKRGC